MSVCGLSVSQIIEQTDLILGTRVTSGMKLCILAFVVWT